MGDTIGELVEMAFDKELNEAERPKELEVNIVERLRASDYTVYREQVSEIDPTKTIEFKVVSSCPLCKMTVDIDLKNGAKYTCGNCNLSRVRNGNGLKCTISRVDLDTFRSEGRRR